MKISFTLLLLLFVLSISHAQELPDFDKIELSKAEHFNEQADAAALTAANYLLSTPLDAESLPRVKATQYILKWMSGTPHYKFEIDGTITKISKKSIDLMGLYLASTTKYCLENKSDAANTKSVKLNTYKLISEYCQKPENDVKVSGELKKMIEANQNGKLEEYLKL